MNVIGRDEECMQRYVFVYRGVYAYVQLWRGFRVSSEFHSVLLDGIKGP